MGCPLFRKNPTIPKLYLVPLKIRLKKRTTPDMFLNCHRTELTASPVPLKLIMLLRRFGNAFLDIHQIDVDRLKVYFFFLYRRADIAGDVEIEAVGGGFGRQSVILETEVLSQGVVWLPAIAEWRVGHHAQEHVHPRQVK